MPLLFETGFYRVTQPKVLVACSPAVQVLLPVRVLAC
jgi:hypothetical protein